ncbi:MAG: hypothetical protein ACLRO1_08145 [Agathobaculum sp.]
MKKSAPQIKSALRAQYEGAASHCDAATKIWGRVPQIFIKQQKRLGI